MHNFESLKKPTFCQLMSVGLAWKSADKKCYFVSKFNFCNFYHSRTKPEGFLVAYNLLTTELQKVHFLHLFYFQNSQQCRLQNSLIVIGKQKGVEFRINKFVLLKTLKLTGKGKENFYHFRSGRWRSKGSFRCWP